MPIRKRLLRKSDSFGDRTAGPDTHRAKAHISLVRKAIESASGIRCMRIPQLLFMGTAVWRFIHPTEVTGGPDIRDESDAQGVPWASASSDSTCGYPATSPSEGPLDEVRGQVCRVCLVDKTENRGADLRKREGRLKLRERSDRIAGKDSGHCRNPCPGRISC